MDPGPISQQLAAAKQALQSQLAELEKQEKELEESLRPQTVAEVEELEKKLQEGLEELRKRKADLQKAPPKSK